MDAALRSEHVTLLPRTPKIHLQGEGNATVTREGLSLTVISVSKRCGSSCSVYRDAAPFRLAWCSAIASESVCVCSTCSSQCKECRLPIWQPPYPVSVAARAAYLGPRAPRRIMLVMVIFGAQFVWSCTCSV